MSYTLLFRKQSIKQVSRLAKTDQKRLIVAFGKLGENPLDRTLDVKKLKGTKSSFRLRVGDVRAIFELDTKRKEIFVWEVGYRGDIY